MKSFCNKNEQWTTNRRVTVSKKTSKEMEYDTMKATGQQNSEESNIDRVSPLRLHQSLKEYSISKYCEKEV